MKRVFIVLLALAIAGPLATPFSSVAQASPEEAKKCIMMIKEMIGVEPSPKVVKLCKEGKADEAMEAAMSGE